jgi:hypothetical protein
MVRVGLMPAASLAEFEAELREAQARYGHHMQWERGKDGKLRPVDIAAIELPENEIWRSSTNVQKT